MLLLTGTVPERKRQSRPRVLGAFIGAKRRALTDGGAEGITASSPPLLPSLVRLHI
jgi:hypothetical protein